MDSRREFIKKAMLLSGAAGFAGMVPESIQRAMAINPAIGSTFLDAEHIVILMQENRSFDHCFGTLQGVRGFNDPRAVSLPDHKPVWLQTNKKGETYSPFRLNMKDSKSTWMGDLPHSRASQVDAYNKGRYDKWLDAKTSWRDQYAHMPLTLGYYNRQDLPFYYAMADAFTICDQNFCSAMTSTTPNRSFFWTGKVTEQVDGLAKSHMRNSDYPHALLKWQTFPELLEDNSISWKFYQNEISSGGGFQGEERSWLANFGCNLLESFAAYNVKFSPRYIQNLQRQANILPDEIKQLQDAHPSSDQARQKIQTDIAKKQEVLAKVRDELTKWNTERFENLSPREKQLYQKAFVVNAGDPNYRSISSISYTQNGEDRKVTVPAGDVLHQFRQDVDNGQLPMVSWLAAPQNFSDHPSAPMYGAWYVSEIMDILTKNPEVWKKTIFISTYDENDGYFDHVVPFSIPDNNIPGTGKVSAGIETESEHARLENEVKQGIPRKEAREAPIGLGFRVPMIIASPWSRGGKVCSEIFDHTSTLQFLETFFDQKLKKNIRIDNISEWRRTICGDLQSTFDKFDDKKMKQMPFLNRDGFVKDIHSAQFKDVPAGYQKWSEAEINRALSAPSTVVGNVQEEGTRVACALPYELYAEGTRDTESGSFRIRMKCGNQVFGDRSAGSPFTVSAPGRFMNGDGDTYPGRNWSFAVKAGDEVGYDWPLDAFENKNYHLKLYGPNGFYREFTGSDKDPAADIRLDYEMDKKTGKPTGNVVLKVANNGSQVRTLNITDKAYNTKPVSKKVATNGTAAIVLPLGKSSGWYDFAVTLEGVDGFETRYAGHVETGKESITDPFMGKVIG